MILDIAKSVTLATPADKVWALLQEPARVAGCLPSVSMFNEAGPGHYTTLLVEKLGPFAVRVTLTVEVSEDPAARRMTARVAGDDKGGAARVRGEVAATVKDSGDGTSVLDVSSNVEVLGRLASLGAVPMRRRADQIFDQFVRNIGALLEGQHG